MNTHKHELVDSVCVCVGRVLGRMLIEVLRRIEISVSVCLLPELISPW